MYFRCKYVYAVPLGGGGGSVDGEIKLTLLLDSDVISSKAQVPLAILVPFPIVFDTGELLMTRTSAEAC